MSSVEDRIVAAVSRKGYTPLKPKALARSIGVSADDYRAFRRVLKDLLREGRLELAKNHTLRPAAPHGTVLGTYRAVGSGGGFVRPHPVDGSVSPEVRLREGDSLDAATGDTVLVRILRKPAYRDAPPTGRVLRVLERATRQFVGTYFEREGEGLVRVDGTVFSHSVFVGDPGAKGARPNDKVVLEMLRFPGPDDRGEGVIVEVLGPHGQPSVDTLSIIRAFGLPDVFPDAALEEARRMALAFRETDLEGREDFTNDVVVTIDPADAHDFDDAAGLSRDETSGRWHLTVHIADVAHFVPPGGELDREARKRATSVYLPLRVLPMFPEVISNGVASLQQGRLRYVKSVQIDFTPHGQRTSVRFANGAIKVRRRFTYDEVTAILDDISPLSPVLRGEGSGVRGSETSKRKPPHPRPRSPEAGARGEEPDVRDLLFRMRDLAMILRKRRLRHGALELNMPEVELEYDGQGRVSGGHFAKHDVSHQIIEEFMLATNEAVAEHFAGLGVPFLRRVHPAPEPLKLRAFAEFARSLGYKMDGHANRFALQRILARSADKPDVHAVHYALLRSLEQAVYSPTEEGHYALASDNYCHFTSPIRRYPDLTVHRLLARWLRSGKAGSDETELAALGDHCSKMERRADNAERELVKLKLLTYLEERIGLEMEVIITGVADYGFFGQAETLPVEGLVHISTLPDDYYYFEEETHSLIGRRSGRRYRLGDRIHVTVVRVDLQRRQLDFRIAAEKAQSRKPKGKRRHG
jgi:ribonuclease R